MRIKWQPKIALAAALSVFLLIGLFKETSADNNSQAITISPTSIDQSFQPGSINKGSFEIINSGNTTYTYHLYAAPYGVTNEDYSPDFSPIPGHPNVTSWFHFSSVGSKIAARQTATINYTIDVPANASPRGYYVVAFAQTQSKPSTTTGVVITERVGEIFYIRVAGNAQQSGSLLSWQANLLQEPPLTSALRIEDSGAYNFPASASVQIKNIFGKVVYTYSTTREVLPQTIRKIQAPWQTGPKIGIFKIGGSVSFLNQTHKLPTKYVIIASNSVRRIVLAIIIIWLVVFGFKLYKHKQAKNNKPKP